MYCNADLSEVCLFSLHKYGASTKVSENFTLGEFACKDGSDIVLIHPLLPALLEVIRFELGGPLHITSSYRSHLYNKSIGGADKSRHLHGFAADVWTPNVYPSVVADLAESLDVGGVGRYNTFTHLDVQGVLRRWDNTTNVAE